MWRVEQNKPVHPFRHKHANHFPPSPRTPTPTLDTTSSASSHDYESDYVYEYELSSYFEPEEEGAEDVPIFFSQNPNHFSGRSNEVMPRHISTTAPRGVEYALSSPPPFSLPRSSQHHQPQHQYQTRTPSPLHLHQNSKPRPKPLPFCFPPDSPSLRSLQNMQAPLQDDDPPPPTPSSQAPARLTSLLQEVLGIMNTIMGQQSVLEGENGAVQALVELVVIMQEEAETLVELAGLVEEFVGEADVENCDEVEDEVDIGEVETLIRDLELSGVGVGSVGDEEEEERTPVHEKADSGVGLDDGSYQLSLKGSLREMKVRAFPIRREAMKTPGPVRKGAVVVSRIPKERSLKKGKGSPPSREPRFREPPFREAPFRDSALGLLSSDNLPHRMPTWI